MTPFRKLWAAYGVAGRGERRPTKPVAFPADDHVGRDRQSPTAEHGRFFPWAVRTRRLAFRALFGLAGRRESRCRTSSRRSLSLAIERCEGRLAFDAAGQSIAADGGFLEVMPETHLAARSDLGGGLKTGSSGGLNSLTQIQAITAPGAPRVVKWLNSVVRSEDLSQRPIPSISSAFTASLPKEDSSLSALGSAISSDRQPGLPALPAGGDLSSLASLVSEAISIAAASPSGTSSKFLERIDVQAAGGVSSLTIDSQLQNLLRIASPSALAIQVSHFQRCTLSADHPAPPSTSRNSAFQARSPFSRELGSGGFIDPATIVAETQAARQEQLDLPPRYSPEEEPLFGRAFDRAESMASPVLARASFFEVAQKESAGMTPEVPDGVAESGWDLGSGIALISVSAPESFVSDKEDHGGEHDRRLPIFVEVAFSLASAVGIIFLDGKVRTGNSCTRSDRRDRSRNREKDLNGIFPTGCRTLQ
jgi:hypothetical protein